MAKIKRDELTKEMIEKAMACKTADELVALAKEHGFEITTKQAEAYLAELEDFDLDSEQMKKVSGGIMLDVIDRMWAGA